MSPQRITPAPVRKSIRLKVSRQRAFDVFTARIGAWWPKDHHIGEAEMKQAVLEPRLGGRWYEQGIDGSTCLWGEVLVWEPPARIVLSWLINSKFVVDDTVESEVEVRFTADGPGATLVELEHRITAVEGDKLAESVNRGWSGLLDLFAKLAEEGE